MNQQLRDLFYGKCESRIDLSKLQIDRLETALLWAQMRYYNEVFDFHLREAYNLTVELLILGRLYALGLYFMPEELTTIRVRKYRSPGQLTWRPQFQTISGRFDSARPNSVYAYDFKSTYRGAT